MRRPEEVGSPYPSSRQQSKPPGPVGEEAGKYQSCYVQDVPRDKNISSRRPATHKVEETSRRTAQEKAGQNHEQERPGAGSSQSRIVQEQEPSVRTGRPNLPQGIPGEGTGQGRKYQEQGPPYPLRPSPFTNERRPTGGWPKIMEGTRWWKMTWPRRWSSLRGRQPGGGQRR